MLHRKISDTSCLTGSSFVFLWMEHMHFVPQTLVAGMPPIGLCICIQHAWWCFLHQYTHSHALLIWHDVYYITQVFRGFDVCVRDYLNDVQELCCWFCRNITASLGSVSGCCMMCQWVAVITVLYVMWRCLDVNIKLACCLQPKSCLIWCSAKASMYFVHAT